MTNLVEVSVSFAISLTVYPPLVINLLISLTEGLLIKALLVSTAPSLRPNLTPRIRAATRPASNRSAIASFSDSAIELIIVDTNLKIGLGLPSIVPTPNYLDTFVETVV